MQPYSKSDKESMIYFSRNGNFLTYPSVSKSDVTNTHALPVFTQSETGNRNPAWRSQVAKGENATTPGTKVKHRWRKVRWGDTWYERQGDAFDPLKRVNTYWWNGSHDLSPSSWNYGYAASEATKQRASMAFMKKYREVLTAFSGGVFLGELRESLRMLRNPAKSLRDGLGRYVDRVTKTRWVRGRDNRARGRFIRDSWLEYSFGVKPLISDVESAVEALQGTPAYQDVLIRGRAEEEWPAVTTVFSGTYSGHAFLKYQLHTTERRETRYQVYGKVRAYREDNLAPQWNYWGVSFSEVLPTMWEIIPNSFLLDYFGNIGQLIEFYSTNWYALRWTSASESRVWRQMRWHCVDIPETKRAHAPYPWMLRNVSGLPSASEAHTRDTVRYRSHGLTLPVFRFKLPGTSTQFLNLAALARLGKSLFI